MITLSEISIPSLSRMVDFFSYFKNDGTI